MGSIPFFITSHVFYIYVAPNNFIALKFLINYKHDIAIFYNLSSESSILASLICS